ncbi:MAG: glycosyltransferase family A protein [Solirubrobacteraceae bacterium]|jgi:glycosyltransferase involved in cell wall biosynthesis
MSQFALVSVVVPLHDHADVVAQTLDSILGQDHHPVELVVVDDGSCDGGADVVAGYEPRVRVIRQSRMGAASARNRGLDLTSGELVVFFDADDLMPAGRLRRQAAALARHPELDGVFGDVVEFRPGTPWRSEPRPGRLPGSLMLRRRALERAGSFREGGAQVEAVEWAARAHDAGLNLKHLPGVAMERRLHPGNHSRATDHREYLRVLKVILDRRRADGSAAS